MDTVLYGRKERKTYFLGLYENSYWMKNEAREYAKKGFTSFKAVRKGAKTYVEKGKVNKTKAGKTTVKWMHEK